MTISKYRNSPNMLRKIRRDSGFTQEELARKVGVNQSVISRIESGDIDASSRVMESLEEIFEESFSKAVESQMQANGSASHLSDLHIMIDKYADRMTDSAVRAIMTYVDHIAGLSDSGSDLDDVRPMHMMSLWEGNWNWGPKELEQHIIRNAAAVMTWERIFIVRSHAVKVNGEPVMRGEVYSDGFIHSESPLFTFLLNSEKSSGLYNGFDLKIDVDGRPFSGSFGKFILVSSKIPSGLNRSVHVLISGKFDYSYNDFDHVNDIVNDFLLFRGEQPNVTRGIGN